MSRSKQRKARRQKEQAGRRNRLWMGGGLVAVVVAIIGFLAIQSGSQVGPTTTEDGRPIWQTMNLRNVRTGETFTLADFDDREVFAKIMSPF